MKCNTCEKDLPDEDFDPSTKRPGKLKAVCRSCCGKLSEMGKQSVRDYRRRNGMSYVTRNEWLRLLGFKSYREYLRSDLWKSIRVRVYAAKGGNCFLCGKPATELHHNRYYRTDLIGKKLRYINPVCRECHKSIEFDDGRKNDVETAAKKFRSLRRKKRKSDRDGK
jgi:5-methylcytosine-specific restriction endonuclease McrA